MIRAAVRADLPALVALARQFHAEATAGRSGRIRALFDPDHVARLFETMVFGNPQGACFVIDAGGRIAGALAAAVLPSLSSPQVRDATELMWFVEPAARGSILSVRLVAAYERWAEELACDTCGLGLIEALDADGALARFYQRRGYRRSETTYRKSLHPEP